MKLCPSSSFKLYNAPILTFGMNDWIKKLFIERADIFLKIMNMRWSRTKELVNGMIRMLHDLGIVSGSLLDLCCGNGRISICMALKGFKAVGIDISRSFIEDAKRKAEEYGVSSFVKFFEGDVRKLREIIKMKEPFNVVVNAWTSIGYFSPKEELEIFKQARELSEENAVLFILETMHTEFLSLKFVPSSYMETEDMITLERRKYNPITSTLETSWTFYRKHGKNLEYVDKVEFTLHVYSLSELSSLLREAGWEPVATYGNLATLQPMSPLTALNLVAVAK